MESHLMDVPLQNPTYIIFIYLFILILLYSYNNNIITAMMVNFP